MNVCQLSSLMETDGTGETRSQRMTLSPSLTDAVPYQTKIDSTNCPQEVKGWRETDDCRERADGYTMRTVVSKIELLPNSPLEALVQELLDLVFDHSEVSAIARLGQCNKYLRARILPSLYGNETNRNRAMKWACGNGVIGTIQVAMTYRAPVSTVSILGNRRSTCYARHIPACAAAHVMATLGRTTTTPEAEEVTSRMRMGLDRGADINVRVPVLKSLRRNAVIFTTPLLFFVRTVFYWGDPNETDSVALRQLQYLLNNGANADFEGAYLVTEPVFSHVDAGTERPLGGGPIQCHLDRWSILKLTGSPQFLEATKLLIRHRGLKTNTGRILSKYDAGNLQLPQRDSTDVLSNDDNRSDDLSCAWKDLLTVLLSSADYHEDLNTFLYNYVTTKATVHGSPAIGKLTRVTVLQLLEAGANVNTRKGGDESEQTILHALCSYYGSCGLGSWHVTDIIYDRRVALFRFLVEDCGADPKVPWEGKTPAQVLIQGRVQQGIRWGREFVTARDWEAADELLACLNGGVRVTGMFRDM
ncbi:hypothetical protein QBC35DRAFT_536229 [Podospora australis]|uniref:Ankyrin repeat protein n=1 Tax=Podospora australis TaxID=1536484 RepID=A0AAN6WK77_9PEZI|nr:hypothetical protein QBC35DRAFT_536229 [Podospora australis]